MMYTVGPDDQTLEKSRQWGQFEDLALLSNATARLGDLELVLNVKSYIHLWAHCRALSVKSYHDS